MRAPSNLQLQRAEILAAARKRHSVADIAREFHVSRNSVYVLLREHDIAPSREPSRFGTRNAEIAAAAKAGTPVAALAEKHGMTRTYIYQVLHRHGVDIRAMRPGRTGERDRAILEAAASGMSVAEIADRFDLTAGRIYQVLRRRNGPRRARSAKRRRALVDAPPAPAVIGTAEPYQAARSIDEALMGATVLPR